MRWTKKTRNIPFYGEERIIKKFAFFPVGLGCEKRWLEMVYIKQKWIGGWYCSWSNLGFVTEEEWWKYFNSPHGKYMRENGW